MDSSYIAYADESLVSRNADVQDYLVCATILERSQLKYVRDFLRPLLLPGQIKLHWTGESEKRRHAIIQALSELDTFQVIITDRSTKRRKSERNRRKCLEALYFELTGMMIADVTLESRQESLNRKDIEHIVALQAAGQFRGIQIRHVRGGDDPLLWIPDAVLGAYNCHQQGVTQYWEALRDTVVLERRTADSL